MNTIGFMGIKNWLYSQFLKVYFSIGLVFFLSRNQSAAASTIRAITCAEWMLPKINVLSPRKASRKRRYPAVKAMKVTKLVPAGDWASFLGGQSKFRVTNAASIS